LRGGVGVALGQFEGYFAHFFMDEAVGGEDNGAAEDVGSIVKIGDFSASFLDEKDARGGVPPF
jgi:hypothetical protein